MGRAPCCDKSNVKRGPWSPEEDATLTSYLESHGTGGNWIALPHKAGLRRCGKSCRLRWLNYLRPDIKHGGFTQHEDNIICTLYNNIGSRWSVIASHLPGRTDNDVKNHWNTKLKKKLQFVQQQFTTTTQEESSTSSSTAPTTLLLPPALIPPVPKVKTTTDEASLLYMTSTTGPNLFSTATATGMEFSSYDDELLFLSSQVLLPPAAAAAAAPFPIMQYYSCTTTCTSMIQLPPHDHQLTTDKYDQLANTNWPHQLQLVNVVSPVLPDQQDGYLSTTTSSSSTSAHDNYINYWSANSTIACSGTAGDDHLFLEDQLGFDRNIIQ